MTLVEVPLSIAKSSLTITKVPYNFTFASPVVVLQDEPVHIIRELGEDSGYFRK